MKQFWAFVQKEIYHILRDRRTLLVLIGIPIVQILLFGFALSNEVKNARISIWDQSKDDVSREIIAKISASKYFDILDFIENEDQIDQELRSGNSNLVIILPNDLANSLNKEHEAKIQLIADGIDPNISTTLINYASAVIYDYQREWMGDMHIPLQIQVLPKMMYNPQLKAEFTFVPGVMALVLMLICTMMTSVSIVREKELGNMEILLVSPLPPLSIVFSKTIPYFILSLIILSIILLLGVQWLQVPINGSLFLLFGVSMIFIFNGLALGLLISSFAKTQQVAMLISLVGLMLPTMLLSGFMFPVESMPLALRLFSNIVPAKWYFFSLQSIMIKGLGLKAILKDAAILSFFALFFMAVSIRNFKIRLS